MGTELLKRSRANCVSPQSCRAEAARLTAHSFPNILETANHKHRCLFWKPRAVFSWPAGLPGPRPCCAAPSPLATTLVTPSLPASRLQCSHLLLHRPPIRPPSSPCFQGTSRLAVALLTGQLHRLCRRVRAGLRNVPSHGRGSGSP